MVIIFVPMGVAFTVIALLWTIYHDCRNRVCIKGWRKKLNLEENAAGAGVTQEERRSQRETADVERIVEEIPRLPMFKWAADDIPRLPAIERRFGTSSRVTDGVGCCGG
jgi:hypothetical protein